MPPRKGKRSWWKMWWEEWLTGTIREDLTSEQRGIWVDFLALATRNRIPGCISANEDTALSVRRLAQLLNVPPNVVSRAMGKFVEQNRISVDDRGIIHITNWDAYQYSDYDRQKPWRDARREAGEEPQPDDARPDDSLV